MKAHQSYKESRKKYAQRPPWMNLIDTKFDITVKQRQALEYVAKNKDISRSKLMRDLLDAYLLPEARRISEEKKKKFQEHLDSNTEVPTS